MEEKLIKKSERELLQVIQRIKMEEQRAEKRRQKVLEIQQNYIENAD